mgnify:FL=1
MIFALILAILVTIATFGLLVELIKLLEEPE